MEENFVELKNKGMWQDAAISKSPDDYAYENHNIRIILSQDGTQLAVTNERSNDLKAYISGYYLGGCKLGDYFISFSIDEYNGVCYIELFDFSDNENVNRKRLYKGNLNFDKEHKIECLPWYESESVQKVYWIDGINPIRVININGNINESDDTQFDFKASIDYIPKVDIYKDYSVPGMFSQGTVQYFITYYRKFSSETGIVWISSLQYISYKDKGAKADENVSVSFNIDITDFDRNFDYVRVYSAYRSTVNGAIALRVVGDVDIPSDTSVKKISITDTGTNGYEVDSNILQFIGGQDIIANTMTQKDGVLFIGDIDMNMGSSSSEFNQMKEYIESTISNIDNKNKEYIRYSTLIEFTNKFIPVGTPSGYYYHFNQLNKSEYSIKTYKHGEIYRFAFQFMDSKCTWTEPIWAGDLKCDIYPEFKDGNINVANAVVDKYLYNNLRDKMKSLGYIAYRLLCAETSSITRSVVAQGVVSPTLFNYNDRFNNKPFAINSWNFRPRMSGINSMHLQSIGTQDSEFAELQGLSEEKSAIVNFTSKDRISDYDYFSIIMGFDGGHECQFRIVLFNATDEELNNVLNGGNITDYKSIIGSVDAGYLKLRNWDDVINKAYDKMSIPSGNDPSKQYKAISINSMPSVSEIKSIIGSLALSEANSIIHILAGAAKLGIGMLAAPSVAAEPIMEILNRVLAIKQWDVKKAVIATSVLGMKLVSKSSTNGKSDIEKTMASKGWVYVGDRKDVESAYSDIFKGGDIVPKISKKFVGSDNGSFWITGGKLAMIDTDVYEANSRTEQFYIDENIVTLNSPDIEGNEDLINNNQSLKLRIIGCAPINAVYNDFIIETENNGVSVEAGIITKDTNNKSSIGEATQAGLMSGFLYTDGTIIDKGSVQKDNYDLYKVFLWNRETSLSAGGGIPGVDVGSVAKLKRKVFANLRYSMYNNYSTLIQTEPYNILTPSVYNDDDATLLINNGFRDVLYSGSVDTVVAFTDNNKYKVITEKENTYLENNLITDPVRIKYNSTQHAVMALGRSEEHITLLPRKYNDRFSSSDPQMIRCTEVGYDKPETGIIDSRYIIPIKPTTKYELVSAIDFTNTSGYTISKDDDGAYTIDIELTGDAFYLYIDTIVSLIRDNVNGGHYSDATRQDALTIIRGIENSNEILLLPVMLKDGSDNSYINCFLSLEVIPGETGNESYAYIYTKDMLNGVVIYPSYIYKDESGEDKAAIWVNEKTFKNYHLNSNQVYIVSKKGSIKNGWLKSYSYNSLVDIRSIATDSDVYQHVLIGELYRDIKYSTLYGGYNDDAMKNIRWNVCSSNTNADEMIMMSWGDTYYQRWDCLKTYPKTEEDTNGIVDILSFMVETHKNIDGRCDVNRGTANILNARPKNWNLMNDSYTQNGNMFSYSILDEKFNISKYKNQIIWSEKKTDLSDIDTWTNINTFNALSLDGKFGKITKLECLNNTIIAFQEDAISSINFNNRTQLSTEQGTPVEIANSGKVNGYDIITENNGCLDKKLECKGSSGVYFIDGNRASIMRLSKEGVSNIGISAGMSTFFNKYCNNVDKLFYDELTNDMYIIGNKGDDKYCMNYNELTSSFVSFLPYSDCTYGFCINGKSYFIQDLKPLSNILELYKDEYRYKYSISYRVNKEPYLDKVFTTIDYVADMFDNEDNYLYSINPFDKIEAETEYQRGETKIPEFFKTPQPTQSPNKPTFRSPDLRKFRIRRVQIPRDENSRYKLDRIRNPWCKIKLSGDANFKMVFHQAFVRYYK